MRVPKKGLKRYGYEPEADYPRGTGAELAVAGNGDGSGRPETGSGGQGTPAKDSAHSCRRPVGVTWGAIFVCEVAGASMGYLRSSAAVAAGGCAWLGSSQSRRRCGRYWNM